MEEERLFDMITKTKNPNLYEAFVKKWEREVYGYALVATGRNEEKALELAKNIFLDLWQMILEGNYQVPVDRWVRCKIRMKAVEVFRSSGAKEKYEEEKRNAKNTDKKS